MGTIDLPSSPTANQTYSISGKTWKWDGVKWTIGVVASSEPWVRPSNWLTLPDVTGLQKFAGLHAVYPDSNFVALSAEGNFTVNYGDGSGDTNIASGVTTEYNIPYANAPTTSDVGITSAVACTFTDAGAGDAYPLGARVTHNGQTWTSNYAANVWEPGVFGWTAD